MRILNLTDDTRKDILEDLLKRSPNNYGEFEGRVNAIISTVKEKRDEAVFSYTKQFDGADIDSSNIKVTKEEIEEAYSLVDPKLLDVIRKALVNIKDYHKKGVTVLLVEQNAKMALSISDRAYVLETGSISLSGNAQELLANDEIKKAYLGG